MSPEDIKAINEALDIQQAQTDLDRRERLNQEILSRRFSKKVDTNALRFVLDVNIITVSSDSRKIKVSKSPLDGIYKTPPKEEDVEHRRDSGS